MHRIQILFCFFLLLLTGCSNPPDPQEYKITHVITNPSVVGSEVALYGVFPEKPVLLLDLLVLNYRPIPDGIMVRIPRETQAGLHHLQLKLGDTIKFLATIELLPTIEKVEQIGRRLTFTGAGWNNLKNNVQSVQIQVNGQVWTPQDIQHHTATLNLPDNFPYGTYSTQLVVNGKYSAPFNIIVQAASVSGRVSLPATPPLRLQLKNTSVPPQGKALLVYMKDIGCTLPSDVPQATHVEIHGTFQVKRMQYAKVSEAQEAKATFQKNPCVWQVEYDDILTLQEHGQVTRQESLEQLGNQWFWALEGLTKLPANGGSGITVAILDTGVHPHEEFVDVLLPGKNFYNVQNGPTNDTTDHLGHGTHVAGLIAAHKRLISPAPSAQILPIKVTESSGSVLALAQGILFAVDALPGHPNPHPAQVLNMSVGQKEYSTVLAHAVQVAQSKGAILVAATGNKTDAVNYPAALPGVIGVTAVSGPRELYQPAYAAYGPGTVISAIGGDPEPIDQNHDGYKDQVLSTDLNGYSLRSGTSMAAPQVSGFAALLLSQGVPERLVRDTLTNTSTDLGIPGFDVNYGSGLVRAGSILTQSHTSYVVALHQDGSIAGWTRTNKDGTYTLTNLPPSEVLNIRAMSDSNNNESLAESGEWSSPAHTVQLAPGEHHSQVNLQLNPTDGTHTLHL